MCKLSQEVLHGRRSANDPVDPPVPQEMEAMTADIALDLHNDNQKEEVRDQQSSLLKTSPRRSRTRI